MTGRPRDPAVDDAIRRAAVELVDENGYRGLSMEGIAARSGVSKQTVYRRYRGKGEVVLEVQVGFAAVELPAPDTGSLRGDLGELLTATFRSAQGVAGTLNRALAAEALQDEEFTRRMWEELIAPRRAVVGELLARGRTRGEVGHPDDAFLIDLVYAPLWYGLLFGPGRLTDAYAAELAEAVCRAAA
ncbi:TetR/AcrR family transcriptional regulator [Kitasatospora sp. NBC_01287]|uniref:TetR/AcrR family transcriptional regulator n=1 Tax=Kitasatospora sp. NBC_01287 TaxID=2903573 RepID=UPI00224DAFF2|nr:TetR/AcrR family transcriptional regulator [Kitasatospora sp. NBC_01287]MCX4749116.1 TetR/AcrR family transcriptional regulator [Kitasatospora sp. NBC_01287]